MQQSSLLPTGERLIDDATGQISYVPALLRSAEAEAAFVAVRAAVAWCQERREMYGSTVAVPRLTASYRLDVPELPAAIADIARRVRAVVPAPFNTVGLNLYRDGNDSVALHNDHLYEIAAHQPIALVSLGAVRRMVIRTKQAPYRMLRLDLEPGSLLVMSYATQLHYDHGVPKRRGVVGPRISLAFRVRPKPEKAVDLRKTRSW